MLQRRPANVVDWQPLLMMLAMVAGNVANLVVDKASAVVDMVNWVLTKRRKQLQRPLSVRHWIELPAIEPSNEMAMRPVVGTVMRPAVGTAKRPDLVRAVRTEIAVDFDMANLDWDSSMNCSPNLGNVAVCIDRSRKEFCWNC